MNSKVLVKLWVVLLCSCSFSNIAISQTLAPNDPSQAEFDEQYITPNLVDDPLAWSGPESQGDCTYRPDGHGTWGSDPAHTQGTWYSNPAYRSCPQISSDGVMRFSWRPEEDMVLTNNIDNSNPIIAPYAEALAQAGIVVNGYNYSWIIKSADAGSPQNTLSEGPYDKEGYGYSQDLLSITVEFIGQENQDVVYTKEYEYNYRIENWREFSGSESFDLNGTDFEKIRITVDGFDAGYWGGYYGPEVRDVQFQLIFTVVETDNCDEDPLSSPTCYGYQDAFNKSVGLPTQAETIAKLESDYGGSNVDATGQQEVEDFFDGGTPDGTSFEYDEDIEMGIEAEIEVFEQEQLQAFEEEQQAQQTGTTVNDGQSTGISQEESSGISSEESSGISQEETTGISSEETTGISQEETTGISSEETTGVADPVEEAAEAAVEATAEATAEATETAKTTSTVNGLSVAQGAEAAGNAVTGSAVSLATGAALTSLNSDIAISTSLNQQSQQQSQLSGQTQLNQQSQQQTQQQSSQGADFSSGSGGSSFDDSYSSGNSSGNLGGDVGDQTDPTTGLLAITSKNSSNSSEFGSELEDNQSNNSDQSFFLLEVELASLDQNIIDNAINSVIDTIMQNQNEAMNNFKEDTSDEGQLTAEEEDALVASAQSGDTSEDAQAALLGYNPNFRAYQTPQMQDAQFYAPKDIYATQKNYDNPNQRFFSGASDATHREMVRQQYGGQ
jgi:hypothetical protein